MYHRCHCRCRRCRRRHIDIVIAIVIVDGGCYIVILLMVFSI